MTAERPLQRVVYVVSLFPCWSETFIVREIGALIERGVDVRIISLKRSSEQMVQPDAAALLDRVHHPLPPLHGALQLALVCARHPLHVLRATAAVIADGWRTPLVMAKSLLALTRGFVHVGWLRRFDPQLIHAHWATYPSTVAWALAPLMRRPFGFTCHAHDIFVERQLLRSKIARSALAVTISRYNVDWLQRNVSDEAATKLRVVHCGVDLQRTPLLTEGRDAASILAVGRLDPIKGFDTLIEALALLRRRGVACRCTVIGSGDMGEALAALAAQRDVADMIVFAGAQPQPQVRLQMDRATAFVMPSQVAADGNRDGIPVALMEAMASGCPVVATRVSGIPELVEHGVTGLLVDAREPGDLADALQRLLADAALRTQLAAGARARIETSFDARVEAGRLMAFMQEVAHVC